MLAETFWELFTDPAHWEFEVFLMLLFDFFFGFIVWQRLLKPYIAKRHAQAIAEEHEYHGLEEHDHALHEAVAHSSDPARTKRLLVSNTDINPVKELERAIDVALYHLDQGDDEVAWQVLTQAQAREDGQ